jgi:hypothetical protein
MNIPEIGQTFINLLTKEFLVCDKRTRKDGNIYIWCNGDPIPIQSVKTIEYNLEEALQICQIIRNREQGIAIRTLLSKMGWTQEQKQALWEKLSPQVRHLMR